MINRLSVSVLLLGLAGCKAEGGASIFSAIDARESAAIGFLVDCEFDGDDRPVLVAAAIRYDDPAAPRRGTVGPAGGGQAAAAVRIRGRVERAAASGVDGICVSDPTVARAADEIVIEGRYWPASQPLGEEGRFEIAIEKSPGADVGGAEFRIELIGGAFDGHVNQGVLNDARITYIDEEAHVP